MCVSKSFWPNLNIRQGHLFTFSLYIIVFYAQGRFVKRICQLANCDILHLVVCFKLREDGIEDIIFLMCQDWGWDSLRIIREAVLVSRTMFLVLTVSVGYDSHTLIGNLVRFPSSLHDVTTIRGVIWHQHSLLLQGQTLVSLRVIPDTSKSVACYCYTIFSRPTWRFTDHQTASHKTTSTRVSDRSES